MIQRLINIIFLDEYKVVEYQIKRHQKFSLLKTDYAEKAFQIYKCYIFYASRGSSEYT